MPRARWCGSTSVTICRTFASAAWCGNHYSDGDGGYTGSNAIVNGELSVLVDLAHVRRAGSPYVRLSGVIGWSEAWGGALTLGWRL